MLRDKERKEIIILDEVSSLFLLSQCVFFFLLSSMLFLYHVTDQLQRTIERKIRRPNPTPSFETFDRAEAK